jgi:hypothetical protein
LFTCTRVLPIVYKCKIKEPHKRRPRPDMGWSTIKEEEEEEEGFVVRKY